MILLNIDYCFARKIMSRVLAPVAVFGNLGCFYLSGYDRMSGFVSALTGVFIFILYLINFSAYSRTIERRWNVLRKINIGSPVLLSGVGLLVYLSVQSLNLASLMVVLAGVFFGGSIMWSSLKRHRSAYVRKRTASKLKVLLFSLVSPVTALLVIALFERVLPVGILGAWFVACYATFFMFSAPLAFFYVRYSNDDAV